ncbi:D-aminoacyl-tRNA deacylase-like [Haliotis asinina]|uniref:D-aminoacyl-tRNA deacylase-like n=1 Tax=Haliotis asinina TaxID=109174 RepID=UPI003531E48E
MEKVVQGLRQLGAWILGLGTSIEELHRFFNRNVRLTENCTIHEGAIAGMRHLCRAQGWRAPVKFSLHPLNSPACLRQWRVLLHLLNFISEDRRREFCLFWVPTPSQPRWTARSQSPQAWDKELMEVDGPEEMWLPEDRPAPEEETGAALTEGATGCDPGEEVGRCEEWWQPEAAEATVQGASALGPMQEGEAQGLAPLEHLVDSHFHLDRTWKATFGAAPLGTTPDLLQAAPVVDHRMAQLQVWGVEVYCDPPTYPSQISADPRYRTAVGLHPKKVEALTDGIFRQLLGLWGNAACIVGEIGLDHSVPAKEWKRQEKALKELLPHAPAGRPIVLHIRGPNGDEEAGATYARMMQLLLAYLPPEQPLVLHCFSGGEETVREWLRTFPNVYFGYAGQVRGFNSDQVAGLRAVPLDHLLVETDSPYMPPEGHRRNSPALLCLVGDLVAEARGMTTEDFLRAATENATRLFWW